MSKSLDPLKETAQDLHRFWFALSDEKQWYAIMKECRAWFGKNWKCQPKVRRKLESYNHRHTRKTQLIWFEVPDTKFATWISVKHGIQVQSDSKLNADK
jgi:uncharacterized protein (DUF924 family)